MNIPNAITTFRIILIPVFISVFYLPYDWAPALATFIFWFAAITDWFDGYLARKLNQQSSLGAFIDPLADKLMVVSALLIILAKHPESNWLLFSSLVIISREIFISSLREWMSSMGESQVVAVSFFGKAKTVAQMFALLFLIYEHDIFGLPTYTFGLGLLVWSAILTMVSMAVYTKSAWQTLSNSS
ncbi:CDP-diacylglycerol--glycerol-3-phosphate 3-phosphatidyltransferase [hydrothermal vent metagenome]|uniref:CDP-diacylglycerol--glycerol-3-phosphate 3-phosphatidyltransferase n=1 Tax=hydrothermal vent metagenome TaxID=652676 RepID=A0A3B0WQE2_9ZZZZ